MKELQLYIANDKNISIRKQCELLDVSRSNLYYEPKGESEENLKLMRLMDEEFLVHPTHGVLQMQDFLVGAYGISAISISVSLRVESYF